VRRMARREETLMAISVLVVDDSSAMRAFIKRVFAVSGVEIDEYHQAANGKEALALLESHWVDLILTDINMPVMDGEEFLERLRQDELYRDIPVIVVSTDGTEHRMQRLIALGAKDYVSKPFAPETLRSGVEKVLGV